MITIDELIELCRKHAACNTAVAWLRVNKTIEEAMDHPQAPEWAVWAHLCIPELPDDAKRLAERVAGGEAYRALDLVLLGGGIPPEQRRMLELRVCGSRVFAPDLLGSPVPLHPDTRAKLEEMGILRPTESK